MLVKNEMDHLSVNNLKGVSVVRSAVLQRRKRSYIEGENVYYVILAFEKKETECA